jgi:hypothetical protein
MGHASMTTTEQYIYSCRSTMPRRSSPRLSRPTWFESCRARLLTSAFFPQTCGKSAGHPDQLNSPKPPVWHLTPVGTIAQLSRGPLALTPLSAG